ncbi:unnamed protein product [Vitrella brassicaformis CCMP3155]|uniref:Uncharacterized protein n=2 Tax=Vitrella brassicaformis TaxID=1169539 RepID=A0A0G4FH23_VITBC|nr:unnamed protein product [Vitrella brassicaformis CCMP3155]|mmetsp:Transcript_32847/g.81366  ORF Transcript_32847/g.81366 Transcript_32847/m.81366 type:complete len:349 (+) Transcript_32847:80-1126(+)|eukprot:CEM12556.1 unnamed protein product [Vitrella brassicaformis CCMP3155]
MPKRKDAPAGPLRRSKRLKVPVDLVGSLVKGPLLDVILFSGATGIASLSAVSKEIGEEAEGHVKALIDKVIKERGLGQCIAWEEQPATLKRHMKKGTYMIRLLHCLENLGDSPRIPIMLRLAHRQGLLPALPVTLNHLDVKKVPSRKDFDDQPESVRVMMLLGHRLKGRHGSLAVRCVNGGVMGTTFYTPETVPAAYANLFNAKDPVCRAADITFSSYTDATLHSILECDPAQLWGVRTAAKFFIRRRDNPNLYDVAATLINTPAPAFGCTTIDAVCGAETRRLIILRGLNDGDNFSAFVRVRKWDSLISVTVRTTEAGAAAAGGWQATKAAAIQVMGNVAQQLLYPA